MAQKFNNTTYLSDIGLNYNIRVSNNTLTIASNVRAVAPDDGNVDVSVSHHGQKRRVGINSRGIVVGLPAVAPAKGYSQKTFVPILTKAAYDALIKGDLIAYAGGQWQILDKVAEV